MTLQATFTCGACGTEAATVTLVAPGEPDPSLTPEPAGAPPGISTLFSSAYPDRAQLAIAGGPLSVTHGGLAHPERAAAALRAGDAAALFAIDSEYAPFWCPRCGQSYCREHFRSWMTFDDTFYDATYAVCPSGHERKIDD